MYNSRRQSRTKFINIMYSICALLVTTFILMSQLNSGSCTYLLSSDITICKRNDPNLNVCLKNATQKGIPYFVKNYEKYDLDRLDPLNIGRVPLTFSAVNVVFDKTLIYGMGKAKVNFFNLNQEKKAGVVSFTTNMTVRGRYALSGQLLLLPIKGEGAAKIKNKNQNITILFSYEEVKGDDEKNHWNVTNYTYVHSMEHAQFKFSHLFEGFKVFYDLAMNYFSSEWKFVMDTIAPPMIDKIVRSCIAQVNKIFKKLSLDEILPLSMN